VSESALAQEFVVKPRCLHGEIWNRCETCRCYAWCEDCGMLVDDLDEPPHPRETLTCASCVDRMIGPAQ
jgi:hypothetical protein